MHISLQFDETAELSVGRNDAHAGLVRRWLYACDHEVTVFKHAKVDGFEGKVQGNGARVGAVGLEMRDESAALYSLLADYFAFRRAQFRFIAEGCAAGGQNIDVRSAQEHTRNGRPSDVVYLIPGEPSDGFPILRNRYWVFCARFGRRESKQYPAAGIAKQRRPYALRGQQRHLNG